MKKRKWILTSASLIIAVSVAIFFHYKQNNLTFRSFTDMVFRNEVAVDTLNLHFTIANPEKFGIVLPKTTLPLFDINKEKEQYARAENYLAALDQFNTKDLSSEDAYTFQLLKKKLDQELSGDQFFYSGELLSPSCGIQSQFPILMAEYAFRNKRDIDDYLKLLSDTPSYFKSIYEFESEKAKRGYLMPDFSLNKTIEQCNSIIKQDDLDDNTHFLLTTFEERIHKAVADGIIKEIEGESYKKRNKLILKDKVLPAYHELASSLKSLFGKGKNNNGLCYFPNGKEYYAWLLIQNTGSYTDIETIYNKLAKDYYDNLHSLNTEIEIFKDTCDLSMNDISYFPISEPNIIIKDLSTQMSSDFPSLSSIAVNSHSTVTVKEVSNSLEDYTAPAYYLTPPIDDISSNVIYINTKNESNGISLYSTLAHEGYPGHLYQTVYYQLYQQSKNAPPVRNIMNYGGYIEGWALYTELYSFDYASKLLSKNTDKKSYDTLFTIYADERKAQLSLLSLLDIAIHYYGIKYDRVKEILNSYGISDETQIKDIYENIVEEPTTYPKYYWGYLEIMRLKDNARKYWGSSYSDYRFHQFFLQAGPSDFESLNSKLVKSAIH